MVKDAWRAHWRDAAWAGGLAVLALASAATAPPNRIQLDLTGHLLLIVAAIATAMRREAPILLLGVTTACLLAYEICGYPGLSPILPVLIALYATVKAGHRAIAGAAIGVILIGGFIGEVSCSQPAPDVFQRWSLIVGWLVAATVAAELSRQRHAYIDQVEQRAANAERTREETAQRRADQERVRIARELHDSLTHSISIIKVHAGVAIHLANKRDEPVPDALVAIQRASSEAMRELRGTLEVLRSDGDQGGHGLARLENLLDGAREAGLPVIANVTGEPRELPAPVDRTVYRIIQEALTNVTRHAGPATASVNLSYDKNELTVRIDDDGRGNAGANVAPGVGLTGMRERITALGGSLHAGPRRDGGFSVRAKLPLEAQT